MYLSFIELEMINHFQMIKKLQFDNWNDMINPITLDKLKLVIFRHQSNRKKEEILFRAFEDYEHLVILDIGSGVGGDLFKYQKLFKEKKISKVYFVEPNPKNILELNKRRKSVDYPNEIIQSSLQRITSSSKI